MFNANSGVFVPQQQLQQQPSYEEAPAVGEMNALSSSFTPTGNITAAIGGGGVHQDSTALHQEPTSSSSQVSRNGTYFYPPEGHSAAGYDDILEPFPPTSPNLSEQNLHYKSQGGGIDWALGSTTVQAHPPNSESNYQQQAMLHHAAHIEQKRTIQTLGVNCELYDHLRANAMERLSCLPPTDPRLRQLPPQYHSPRCLDNNADQSLSHVTSGSLGYPSICYKVVSQLDGRAYALRRFEGVKCSQKIAESVEGAWGQVSHPTIVSLQKTFVMNRTLFFVHTFYPQAKTLKERYIDTKDPIGNKTLLPEPIIWRYVSQLVALIKSIHDRGMAVRVLDMSKILRCAGGRVRVSSCGVVDALEFESRRSISDLQREDMIHLGRVILSLCTRSLVNGNTDNQSLGKCILFVSQNYSPDLHALALTLISKPLPIFEITSLMANHLISELETVMGVNDAMERELEREHESGRGLRLLMKLGFVNERPEHMMDTQWSETGDRYVLKLFRDFVFHQVDENMRPVMDLGHVVSSLNKLDAHDSEKIVLASRDGQALLVVSYADVAVCLENAYLELVQAEDKTEMAQQQLERQQSQHRHHY